MSREMIRKLQQSGKDGETEGTTGEARARSRPRRNKQKDRRTKTMTMLANRTETRVLTLADYEARIHLYKEQIGTGYIGIGRTLLEAKEAKVVPHGQWESWVTETTGLTPRQAQRCMQAATEIKDGTMMARLEMSKALLLLSSGLNAEQQEEIAGTAVEEGATVKDLREQLRKAKLQIVQETGAAAEIREALKKSEDEREQIKAQMRETISGYKARLDEETAKAYQQGQDDVVNRHQELSNQIAMLKIQRDEAYERGEKAAAAEAAAEIRKLKADLKSSEELRKLTAHALQEARDTVPENFMKDREKILAAAEDAERRAADAEAELEALKAGNGEDRGTVADKINSAVFQFLSVCGYMTDRPEVLQRVDAQSARNILCGVDILQGWCEEVYKVLDGTVEAEGAVE